MRNYFSSLIVCTAVLLSNSVLGATYLVTSTADAGPGSLRQAILDANANPGADIIQFQIATSGNLFEGSSYAVIEVITPLPVITDALYINGSTQTNTNTGSIAARTVGVDNTSISAIAFPDVYIVPAASFVFPGGNSGVDGNGISIDAADVTIRGIAISGFGNTQTNSGNASAHSDIAVLRSSSARTVNITITECFVSCDPTGQFPAAAQRRSKSNAILVLGNNETGAITNNYIAHSGTYGIHFNGNTDNLSVGPASTTVGNRFWTVTGNRLQSITTNASITAISRVCDAINLMKCSFFTVSRNYINDVEQTGIDIGYNSDDNYIQNNTVTGITRTNAFNVQSGIRIGLCSEKDTLARNIIANNTSSIFKGGVWMDGSTLSQTGVTVKDNTNHLVLENHIYGNNSSGIVLSNNSTGGCYNNKFSRNSIYYNTGIGIDLNFIGTAGATAVTVNDNADTDAGTNNLQNFPIIDSLRLLPGNQIAIYGKAPAGSTVEFFLTDGQPNRHGGRSLDYGEGRTYIGSAVEGSVQDGATGTAAYSLDGNVGAPESRFYFIIPFPAVASYDGLTATATLNENTSEFGPAVLLFYILSQKLNNFSGQLVQQDVKLNWKASDAALQYFEVEHSMDSKNFKSIGKVYAKMNDAYDFVHTQPGQGANYYRLKLVSRSGSSAYSEVINVATKNISAMLVMGNVFTNKVSVRLELQEKSAVKLLLVNTAGQVVRSMQAQGMEGMNAIQLNDLQAIPAGTYLLNVITNNKNEVQKLVKY